MPVSRRSTLARCIIAAAMLLASLHTLAAQQRRGAVPTTPDDRAIVHVLNRVAFGPRPGDIERVRRVGLAAYIDAQLHASQLPDSAMAERLRVLSTVAMTTREIAERFHIPALEAQRQRRLGQGTDAAPHREAMPGDVMRGPRQVFAELTEQKLLRAMYSERQLEEVMVDFWFNHFNVFGGKGATRVYLTEYERDTIRPYALGRFRDLLHATAKSPAMLFYLDNWQSAAPVEAATTARRRPRPGDKRPRGVNENYARELMELHTLGVDGGYTQKDVQEIARVFTGWTIANPRMGGEFRFEARLHDDGEKIVLGHRIKGGGIREGEEVLDRLSRHPSTARFIATKLARRFVSDDPPPALIRRAAARFVETDGDIREVVRTIVTSREFFAPAAYRAKVKTPLEFVASAVRATGMELRTAMPVAQALRELGMPLYMCQPPTGYADDASAWVNAGALLNRMNFALTLAQGGSGGRGMGGRNAAATITADEVLLQVLAGDVSQGTRETIAQAAGRPQALALALGAPEFQKR